MKTKRELLFTIACKLSGELRAGLLKTLSQKTPFDDVLDRPITDEEFDVQLKQAEKNWPKTFGHADSRRPDQPGSWGFSN